MANPKVLTRCTSRYGYHPDEEICDAVIYTDGHQVGGCGEPCSFTMRKSGSGDPPFHWKKKLFAGNVEVPNEDWYEA